MDSLNRKDIAELVGMAAIVVSLVFVGIQMRQTQDIALAEGFPAGFADKAEATSAIREHIEIWMKGAAGEELQEQDAVIFATLVNQLNEAAFQMYMREFALEREDAAPIPAQDFAGFLYFNPGARKVWIEREEFLADNRRLLTGNSATQDWTLLVSGYLSQLDSLQPPADKKPLVDW